MNPNINTPEAKRIIRRVRAIAKLMDASWTLPGTQFRVGIDPIFGLVPGVGDVASAAISVYIIDQARQLGAPQSLLMKMATNVVADLAIGAIPIAGDVFDFAFRANLRNVRLLEAWLASIGRPDIVAESGGEPPHGPHGGG